MTILDQLQTLTYNNIPILFISSNTTGGRKTITHEYPNRDFRFTEDLGKLQKRFSLQVTINSNNSAGMISPFLFKDIMLLIISIFIKKIYFRYK